ncbi:MAG: hypothetical protein ACTSQG_00245 [Promethearchaeota archaeon]
MKKPLFSISTTETEKKQIKNFCKKNGLNFSGKTLEMWKEHIKKEEKREEN